MPPKRQRPLHRLDEAIRRHVEFVINLCDGNLSQAARELAVARRTLQRMMRRWHSKKKPGARSRAVAKTTKAQKPRARRSG